jgi:hypothetical protein
MPQLTLSDWLGLAGITLSLLGFGISIYQIMKTKSAADSANQSARAATAGIKRLDSLIGFTAVSKSLDEIKDAYQMGEYLKLPSLFGQARKGLISSRENHPNLSEDQLKKIQKTLVFLKAMELEAMLPETITDQQKSKNVKSLIDISDEIVIILHSTRLTENVDGK